MLKLSLATIGVFGIFARFLPGVLPGRLALVRPSRRFPKIVRTFSSYNLTWYAAPVEPAFGGTRHASEVASASVDPYPRFQPSVLGL